MRALFKIMITLAPSFSLSCDDQEHSFRLQAQSKANSSGALDQAKPSDQTPPVEGIATVETQAEGDVAYEPIAIGGAYLTCAHPAKVPQNSASVDFSCQLNSDAPIDANQISASFSKVDESGKIFPLKVNTVDLVTMSWSLSEAPESIFIKKVVGNFIFNEQQEVSFSASLDAPIPLTLKPNLWLFNEPNNSGNEDCAEMVNQLEKDKHAGFYQSVSTPESRFNDRSCTSSQAFLCRKNSQEAGVSPWLFSTTIAPFAQYASACPAGYAFSAPVSDLEMQAVARMLDVRTQPYFVWIALSDTETEGEFRLLLK